eukprot:1876950-Amphidinium_carterae.1
MGCPISCNAAISEIVPPQPAFRLQSPQCAIMWVSPPHYEQMHIVDLTTRNLLIAVMATDNSPSQVAHSFGFPAQPLNTMTTSVARALQEKLAHRFFDARWPCALTL